MKQGDLRAALSGSSLPAAARLLILGILGMAACTSTPRKHHGHEEPTCADGYVLDGEVCVPEACGTGTWGDLPVDAGTVYVSAAADGGGGGSAEAPLRSIQPALDLAGARGGGLVAVAAGTYPETLALTTDHAGIHLAGRCRELVTLDASVGDEQTAGIAVQAPSSEVEISGLRAAGANATGVSITSGALLLTDARVEGSAHVGIWVDTVGHLGSARLEVTGCELEGNTTLGLAASGAHTDVSLVDTVVRGTVPHAMWGFGQGVAAWGGAALTVAGGEVAGNTGVGVSAVDRGTEVVLLGTLVRDTRPLADGTLGYGVQASDDAALTLTGAEISRNTFAGVDAQQGAVVSLVDTVVQDTLPDEQGYSMGAVASTGAALQAQGCMFSRNTCFSIYATHLGTEVSLVDTVIEGTHPGGDGTAAGLLLDGEASLYAEGCTLERNAGKTIAAYDTGTLVALVDTVIRDTSPDGDGEFGFGVEVGYGAKLLAEGCEVAGNVGAGVIVFDPGTEVSLVSTVIRDTRPADDGEYGFGVQVLAATVEVVGCELAGNAAVGVLAVDSRATVTLRDTSVLDTGTGYGDYSAAALGVAAEWGSSISATGLRVEGTAGPGLYAAADGSRLSCSGCTLRDNRFAGAAVMDGATLEVLSSTISGTRASVDLGGGLGIYASQQHGEGPPTLLVEGSVLSDNGIAGVYLAGEGSYQLLRSTIEESIALPFGAHTRCGDGVYATGIAAWDGEHGLLLDENSLNGNAGAGLLLDGAAAALHANTWGGNDPDLWVQGEACLSPRDDYAEAPTSEICPTWDRAVCDLEFTLMAWPEDPTPAAAARRRPQTR
ncbi:MAG: right-handed parallel beta-helix repeat-containing protein [Pseudomonadota bacterium]